mmetsp:Transcript_23413/g.26832  ORF Transcript_23413/g.26832 Transcript_23413/m.26832 type:complete len:295 (+) Transcript_23413:26-910(+)
MAIVIINVKKKKESEMSILLRILTNYLQLLVTAMSFNASYPSSLTEIFSPIGRLGSSSDTFLSFDCFIANYQITGPFPSNSIFKLFLTGVLPVLLLMIVSLLFALIYVVRPSLFPSLKRSVVIASISIMFLLHPKLASSSVSIFECVKIDTDMFRVRIDTNIECYSTEHLTWCVLLGVPILAIWIVGAPVAAFVLLYRHIHKGDDSLVKQYFMILYQGLKPACFYWEFVNTLRKVVILMVLAVLVTYTPFYRLIISIVVLVASSRLQIYLKPYKNEAHNEIELLAIISGSVTLF